MTILRPVSPRNSGSPGRGRRSRSLSRPRRSRSRSINGSGITGLSTRITSSDLEKYFNSEGKVLECHLVTDPDTREFRGFAFVTVETTEDADRCIKYLNCSVLEGRLITMEKMADPNKCLSRCINWRNFGGGMNDPPWKKHSFMKMNLVSILAHIQLNAAWL
ncbi:hypothetical protein BDE02_01G091500 [Populus trichocarpa]|nr:hypothetical protein BDE02_01G091500 [Populus trichocarpa]